MLSLSGDRHAGQRSERACRLRGAVDARRALERAIAGDEVERVERRVDALDAVERVAADLDGRDTAGRDVAGDRAGALEHVALIRSPAARGRARHPARASGALRQRLCGVSDGRGSSSRSSARAAWTCAVAGTPVVSMAWSCSA